MAGKPSQAGSGCMGCGCGMMILGIMLMAVGIIILMALGSVAPAG